MQDITGEMLKALRQENGLSRPKLAALADVHPMTVRYWERKESVDVRGWGPKRLLEAMGVPIPERIGGGNFRTPNARARHGVLVTTPQNLSKRRVVCGAKTRNGTPCKCKSIPGKMRCKFHGGLSTGPKTEEGRARIAEAQRRRWGASGRVHDCRP